MRAAAVSNSIRRSDNGDGCCAAVDKDGDIFVPSKRLAALAVRKVIQLAEPRSLIPELNEISSGCFVLAAGETKRLLLAARVLEERGRSLTVILCLNFARPGPKFAARFVADRGSRELIG